MSGTPISRRQWLTVPAGAAAALLLAATTDAVAEPSPRERTLIERLIGYVEAQHTVVFIRNGSEYDSADAAKFLRGKLDALGDDVKTAHEFVERIASRSSMSGKAYQVRTPDGKTIPAARYLGDELKRLQAAGG